MRRPRGTAALAEPEWRRVYGFRVVFTSSPGGFTPPLPRRGARLAGVAGVLFLLAGVVAIGVAVASQLHAPQPSAAAAGSTGAGYGLALARSLPVSVDIPAIGVSSDLLHLGLNRDGTIQVPSPSTGADEAAWYKYSATPGQRGAAVIEGHVDSTQVAGRVLPPWGPSAPGSTSTCGWPMGSPPFSASPASGNTTKANFPAKNHLRRARVRGPAPHNLRRRF